MWHKLARLRRNVQNIRKSPRVADESMFGGMNGAEFPILVRDMNRAQRWNSLSALFRIVLAPFSILSCSSQPHVNGADGLWVTGEFAQLSEMNHLMVNDSMRYAILMQTCKLALFNQLAQRDCIYGMQILSTCSSWLGFLTKFFFIENVIHVILFLFCLLIC